MNDRGLVLSSFLTGQYASSSLGSPVDCVPVLLVVVLLLVAAVAVQLLLLLGVEPPVRRQRAVSALLGLELLRFGERKNPWNARKERREVAQNSKESTTRWMRIFSEYYLNCLIKRPELTKKVHIYLSEAHLKVLS